jgi:hypothetical protein
VIIHPGSYSPSLCVRVVQNKVSISESLGACNACLVMDQKAGSTSTRVHLPPAIFIFSSIAALQCLPLGFRLLVLLFGQKITNLSKINCYIWSQVPVFSIASNPSQSAHVLRHAHQRVWQSKFGRELIQKKGIFSKMVASETAICQGTPF